MIQNLFRVRISHFWWLSKMMSKCKLVSHWEAFRISDLFQHKFGHTNWTDLFIFKPRPESSPLSLELDLLMFIFVLWFINSEECFALLYKMYKIRCGSGPPGKVDVGQFVIWVSGFLQPITLLFSVIVFRLKVIAIVGSDFLRIPRVLLLIFILLNAWQWITARKYLKRNW